MEEGLEEDMVRCNGYGTYFRLCMALRVQGGCKKIWLEVLAMGYI